MSGTFALSFRTGLPSHASSVPAGNAASSGVAVLRGAKSSPDFHFGMFSRTLVDVLTVGISQGVRSVATQCRTVAALRDVAWTNSTPAHPDGISEAAVFLWLDRIARQGVKAANTLLPRDCDQMQDSVAQGSISAVTLHDFLPPHVTLNTEQGMFMGLSSGHDNIVKVGSARRPISSLLDELALHEFLYLDALQRMGNGQAMAIYYDGGQFHFFDPGRGIFHGSKTIVEGQMSVSFHCWSVITAHQGRL